MNIVISPYIVVFALVFILFAIKLASRIFKDHPKKTKIVNYIKHYRLYFLLSILCSSLVLFIIYPYVLIPIKPGEAAIIWSRFGGGVQNHVFGEGTVLLNPFNKIYIYSLRYNAFNHTYHVITRDGLSISIQMTVRYRLIKDKLPILHVSVGPEYIQRLLAPAIGAWIRYYTSQYSAEEIYSSKRKVIQKKIAEILADQIPIDKTQHIMMLQLPIAKLIEIDAFLMRDIKIPKGIREAIIRKMSQKQLNEEFDYRIQIAKKEAQRKVEEATGIAAFQNIVSRHLTENYLVWRGIEATVQLANSNNAKMVVVGGKNGLPLILNSDSKGYSPIEKANSTDDTLVESHDTKRKEQSQKSFSSFTKTITDKIANEVNRLLAVE